MAARCSAECGYCGMCTAPWESEGHHGTQPPLLRCVSCGFKAAFSAAVAHHHDTGHQLTYKGTVQDFSRVPYTKKVSAA
jgi:hypothetical protein